MELFREDGCLTDEGLQALVMPGPLYGPPDR